MNNEINGSKIMQSGETKDQENKSPYHKFNSMQSIENEKINELKNHEVHNRFLSPNSNSKKVKFFNNNIDSENTPKMAKFNKKFEEMKGRDRNINDKKTKTTRNKIKNNKNKFLLSDIMSHNIYKPKKSVNTSFVLKNPNEVLNIVKLANHLYENDEHFQKEIFAKKVNLNNYYQKKNSNLFTSSLLTKKSKKKKIVISLGVNDDKNSLKGSTVQNKDFKRKITGASKFYNSNDKNSYTDYAKNKQKKVIKKGDESVKQKIKSNLFKEENNKVFLKLKSVKLKNENIPEKLLNKDKISKEEKNKNKQANSLNTNKKSADDNNITLFNRKESEIIQKSTNNKKKKFCLFCCLYPNQNGSDVD